MPYQLKLEQFEGPLALLLELIEKRKLSINNVSLAEVTDQYVDYLKKLQDFPLSEAANFVAVASTLMLLKSASLIPAFELSEEETGDIKDLEKRLQIYGEFRNFAAILAKIFGKKIMFSREAFVGYSFDFLEPKGLTKEKLYRALKNVVINLPQIEILPATTVKKTISLGKRISELIERIQKQVEMSFSDAIASNKKEKIEVIVSFLAVLELVKRGFVAVEQSRVFDNIRIKKNI